MDRSLHGGESHSFAAQDQDCKDEAAPLSSEAVQSGTSTPDDPTFGECPFCCGYKVEYEHVDEETGEITDQSFTRPCRRTRCPVCGALNEPYKSSYGQHVADLVRRVDAHPSEVKFVSYSLLKEWADEAGIDWDDSYQVLTGDSGPWSKGVRRLRSLDSELVYVGAVAARPSDGRAHGHMVFITDLSIDQIKEALLRFPLDGHVKTPKPGESAAKFASNCAEYAFENHADSPSARFTASNGAGYWSETWKARRREAVEQKESEGQGAREGVEQSYDTTRDREPPNTTPNGQETGASSRQKAETDGETTERGPPVDLGGQTFRSREGVESAVKHYMSRRVGDAVHVNGLGRAELLQVKGNGDDLRCVVNPEIATEAVTVAWSEIYTRNVPTVEATDGTSTDHDRSMSHDAENHDAESHDAESHDQTGEPGPLERLRLARERAADDRVISRFTHERHDGTREITEKYADGTTDTFTRDAHE